MSSRRFIYQKHHFLFGGVGCTWNDPLFKVWFPLSYLFWLTSGLLLDFLIQCLDDVPLFAFTRYSYSLGRCDCVGLVVYRMRYLLLVNVLYKTQCTAALMWQELLSNHCWKHVYQTGWYSFFLLVVGVPFVLIAIYVANGFLNKGCSTAVFFELRLENILKDLPFYM